MAQYDIDTNLRPSQEDSRDYIAKLAPMVDYPVSVDLKPWADEVEHQGSFGSCTANAGCSLLELVYKKDLNKTVDLSRMFMYYWARELGGLGGQDGGAYPRDLCKAMNTYGTCYEVSWPYTATNLNAKPTDDVVEEAKPFKVLSYERLTGEKITDIRTALAQGIPVLLTMQIHKDFYNLRGDWKAHDWTDDELVGYHEVLVIGYDDASQRILCENSWGTGWGDGGFFGIPYSKVASAVVSELWIVKPNMDLEIDDSKVEPDYNEIRKQKNKKDGQKAMMIIIAIVAIAYAAIIGF